MKKFVPDACIEFTESGKDHTLITRPGDSRVREELGIAFPSLEDTVRAIIEAARKTQ